MLSPMLVLYAIAEQCLPLWGNNISPRGRCLLFSQLTRHQRTRSRIFSRIFKTLVYLHKVMLSTCFHAMTVSVLPLAKRIIVTRFKKHLRLHHISLMAASNYLLHRTKFMSLPTTRLSKCPMKLLGIASAGSASYALLVAANFRPCPVFSTGFVFWYGDI